MFISLVPFYSTVKHCWTCQLGGKTMTCVCVCVFERACCASVSKHVLINGDISNTVPSAPKHAPCQYFVPASRSRHPHLPHFRRQRCSAFTVFGRRSIVFREVTPMLALYDLPQPPPPLPPEATPPPPPLPYSGGAQRGGATYLVSWHPRKPSVVRSTSKAIIYGIDVLLLISSLLALLFTGE